MYIDIYVYVHGKREKVRQMGMQKQRKGREAKGEGSDQLHANDYWDFFYIYFIFFSNVNGWK